MRIITTIGLDLAKKVFHVHGVDAEGNVVVARRLRRKEVLAFLSNLTACLVGIEACGSAHYWAREIARLGHTVKLIPSRYVKPYVKRGKTDPGDAAAICNAVRGHLSEFGIVAERGLLGLAELAAIVRDESDKRLPVAARAALMVLVRQIEMI